MQNFAAFQGQLNQLFDQFFRGGNGEEVNWGLSAWIPPVDLYETEEAFILKAELLGLTTDEIQIEVHDRTLTLRGKRKPEAGITDVHSQQRERVYGSFQRVFALPTTVDAEKIQARFTNGVLELRLAKHEMAKPKPIAVQS
jgi:HSP20 family protein